MKSGFLKVACVLAWCSCLTASALSQGWSLCLDPAKPFSEDFSSYGIYNSLFGTNFGGSGTASYNACPLFGSLEAKFAVPVGGSFGFYYGSNGSVQTNFDDNLALDFGAPYGAGGGASAVNVLIDATRVAYTQPFNLLYAGTSGRYIYAETTLSSTVVFMRADLYGDAVRVAWQLQNIDPATSHELGLWFGQWMAMISNQGDISGSEFFPVGWPSVKPGYVFTNNGLQPPQDEQDFVRQSDPGGFPSSVDFLFGQTKAYGLRVENGPLDPTRFDIYMDTQDGSVFPPLPAQVSVPANTQADEFKMGFKSLLLSSAPIKGWDFAWPLAPGSNLVMNDEFYGNVPPNSHGEFNCLDDIGYIQKYNPTLIGPGQSRLIVQYFHSTFGNSNYLKPYVVTVDAPKLVGYDPDNVNAQLSPNPMTIRVVVDNDYAYAGYPGGQTYQPIQGKVTLTFPKSTGLIFAGGQNATEQIRPFPALLNGAPGPMTLVETCTLPTPNPTPGKIGIQPPNGELGLNVTEGLIDFQVVSDGTQVGQLPYEVYTTMTPGGDKYVEGTIFQSTTPKLTLHQGPNLISCPWVFSDSSWATILGLQAQDFTVYDWQPIQGSYEVTSSNQRGKGYWIVANSDLGSVTLNSTAQQAQDAQDGFGDIVLYPGWNLIGNPYNYPINLGQISGVSAANPNTPATFADLVNQGAISNTLAFWDTNSQSYQYIGSQTGEMESNLGYWIYVFTAQNVVLKFPPLFYPFVVGPTRSLGTWNNSPSQWRVELVARTNASADSGYFGVVGSTAAVNTLQAVKPPTAPLQDVSLSFDADVQGKQLAMAQAYSLAAPTHSWTAEVRSTAGGTVTLTWPNVLSTSTNLRFRLVDLTTNVTRDMRQTSGYTFTAAPNSTRAFRIDALPGGSGRPEIGGVVVSQATRGRGASITISYSLSSDATTSVRILSASGQEVFAITKGRADSAGSNMVTWALRDNANRAVAPGIYDVEIVAETGTGERVRKIVPVNVVR